MNLPKSETWVPKSTWVLPKSAILNLGGIFYRIYRQTDDATKDAMAILKILDFSWNEKTERLYYENGGKSPL